MTQLKLKVGGSSEADGTAFVEAWHRIEAGDETADHVMTFQSWEGLAQVMTNERLRLLQHLHRQEQPSIMALAKALGRQYRRVHDDVTILTRSGLIERDGGGLRTRIDRIEAVIELA